MLLLITFIMTTLSGCYDYKEIDDYAYVFAVGIDRGVSDKWRLTVQFPTMKAQGGGGGGGGMENGGISGEKDGYTIVGIDAPSFFTGLNMLNASIPRRLNFMHTKIIVIGEDLAKSGKLDTYLAPIIRYRQVRRTVHLIVVKGKGLDFLKILITIASILLPLAVMIFE